MTGRASPTLKDTPLTPDDYDPSLRYNVMTRDEHVEAMSRDTQRLCKPGRAPDRLARHRSTSGRLHSGPPGILGQPLGLPALGAPPLLAPNRITTSHFC